MKHLILTLLFLTTSVLADNAALVTSIGNNEYVDFGIQSDSLSFIIKSSEDFEMLGVSRRINQNLRIGGGFGLFKKTFNSTQAGLNEFEGFDRKKDTDGSLSFLIEYDYKPFFVSLVAASPNFSVRRTRIKTRTAVIDPFAPSGIRFDNTFEFKKDSEDGLQYYFNIGLRHQF